MSPALCFKERMFSFWCVNRRWAWRRPCKYRHFCSRPVSSRDFIYQHSAMCGSRNASSGGTPKGCALGVWAAVLSDRQARLGVGELRAVVGEPDPGAGQGGPHSTSPGRLAGRISRVEIQPLVPHFHKGEPVHRRFPPAGAASASRDPLLRWPLGVLAGVRPRPAGGAGRAAMGICAGFPTPTRIYPPREPRNTRGKASRGKDTVLESDRTGA